MQSQAKVFLLLPALLPCLLGQHTYKVNQLSLSETDRARQGFETVTRRCPKGEQSGLELDVWFQVWGWPSLSHLQEGWVLSELQSSISQFSNQETGGH